jgi:hypothetical protein
VIKFLLFVAVGIIIGWNVPQPAWAKQWQDKVVDFVRSVTKKMGG